MNKENRDEIVKLVAWSQNSEAWWAYISIVADGLIAAFLFFFFSFNPLTNNIWNSFSKQFAIRL